jgi:hypothetical protein
MPVPERQQSTCLSSALHNMPPGLLTTLASHASVQTPPKAMQVHPPMIQCKESDRAVPTQGTSKQAMPIVHLLCGILPHPRLIRVAPAPLLHLPILAKVFLTAPEPTRSVAPALQPKAIDTILNALTDKIVALVVTDA